MLVTSKEILSKASDDNYAVGAFNINNMECLQAIISAAEEKDAPVIIQTTEGAIKYAGVEYLSAMVKIAAQNSKAPIALHLDHGTTYEIIVKCIASGWTSVMIDASKYNLEKNIQITKEIVKIAHSCGVSVEAELGKLPGIEDSINVSEEDALHTDPKEAELFVNETNIDSLAISIGTAHGLYKGIPKLDFERLSEINNLITIPLVLHGASGVSNSDLKEAIKRGINKINIDTDLRIAFAEGCKEIFKNDPSEYDPRKICGNARAMVQKVVEEKIFIFFNNKIK